MSKRTHTWIALAVVAVALVPAAILGLFAYMKMTATPLHPNAQEVSSVTQTIPSKRWATAVEDARRIARTDLTEQNFPGLSIAVGVDGEIVWAEGFGWADIESRVPVSPATRFRIGGVSMALTSAAVGLLLEKNRLNLDAAIQTYVPVFPEKQWPVTLRQLMGHVAGIRGDAGDEESMASCERIGDGLPRFAEDRLRFEPGTQFRYSTYGWILVSAAAEAAADEPFYTFMRTQVFEPLGMVDTKADSVAEPNPTRATFYYPKFAADPRYGPDPAREGDYSCFAGAGGFLSTPSDLVRFGMALGSGKLLKHSTVQMLQTSLRLPAGEETGYGLGWDLETVPLAGEPTKMVGHDSEFTIGGSASLGIVPDRGLVVAVTTNITFAETSSLAVKIADVFAPHVRRPAPQ